MVVKRIGMSTKGQAMTPIESLAFWRIHVTAANAAKSRGACWLCCAKVGCNATDQAGETPRELHRECARKIGLTSDAEGA